VPTFEQLFRGYESRHLPIIVSSVGRLHQSQGAKHSILRAGTDF